MPSILLSTISMEIIKPSSPSTQTCHKLSFIDQIHITNVNIPVVLFYPKHQLDTIPGGPKQVSKLVKNSLSETLTRYYPWAGSISDCNARTIECNDSGAEFLEVQANCPMDKVVNQPDSLFPQGVTWVNNGDDSAALTVVQLTHFDCGGIAISARLSHKVGDGSSAYYFLRDWAALTREQAIISSPYFIQDSLVPSPIDAPLVFPEFKKEEFVGKSFVISAPKIKALKALVAAESQVQNPTRTEVVSALVFKCATSNSLQQSHLTLLADVRKNISPALPHTSVGNLFTSFFTPIYNNNEGDLQLPKIVADLRKSKLQMLSSCKESLLKTEGISGMLNAYKGGDQPFSQMNCDMYTCSSMCNLPFHDLDFGWGKPAAASLATTGPFTNMFFLISTHDGGVQAFVNLKKRHMSIFEHDKDLLEFATPLQDVSYD